LLLAIALLILVSCTKTTTSYPKLTRRPRSFIFDFTRTLQKKSPESEEPLSSSEISDGKQLLAKYLGQTLLRRKERSDGNVPLIAPVAGTRRRSRRLKHLYSYLLNSMSQGASSGNINTSLMPARPPPPPPADSHVLRTRASPSATTNAVDYTDEELMGPEGAMMGRDDSKIVCKFSPYRKCFRVDEDGKLVPMRRAQPVNILRVYKRGGKS